MRPSEFSPELYALLQDNAREGAVVTTLSTGNPDRISSLDRTGVGVETGRTRVQGTGPQLVPAWMVEEGWQRLKARCWRSMTSTSNAHPSSALCWRVSQE